MRMYIMGDLFYYFREVMSMHNSTHRCFSQIFLNVEITWLSRFVEIFAVMIFAVMMINYFDANIFLAAYVIVT